MSCQCGCGKLIHRDDGRMGMPKFPARPEKPHYELHVEIVYEVSGVSFDEEPAFAQRARWWVMKKDEVFGTPKCDTPKEAIEFIPTIARIWRLPWRTPRGWIG